MSNNSSFKGNYEITASGFWSITEREENTGRLKLISSLFNQDVLNATHSHGTETPNSPCSLPPFFWAMLSCYSHSRQGLQFSVWNPSQRFRINTSNATSHCSTKSKSQICHPATSISPHAILMALPEPSFGDFRSCLAKWNMMNYDLSYCHILKESETKLFMFLQGWTGKIVLSLLTASLVLFPYLRKQKRTWCCYCLHFI